MELPVKIVPDVTRQDNFYYYTVMVARYVIYKQLQVLEQSASFSGIWCQKMKENKCN